MKIKTVFLIMMLIAAWKVDILPALKGEDSPIGSLMSETDSKFA